MLSVQLGGQYFFTPNVGVMLGPILTHGYEDKQRHTRINGVGLMGAILYNVAEGPFKGLNMYIKPPTEPGRSAPVAHWVTGSITGM